MGLSRPNNNDTFLVPLPHSVGRNESDMYCVHISEAIRAQGIDDWTSYFCIRIMIGFAYAALFLFGLFSNASVLRSFWRNQRLHSARNFFLLNLILTDILLCFTAIPITPWYAMTKDWTFGPVMCRIVPLCNSCAVFVTSWSLTAIAFDKHMHIVVDPTRRYFSRRLIGIVTLLIWLMSIVVNIPYLLSFELVEGFYVVSQDAVRPFCGKFCDEFNWTSESQRRFYGVIVLIFQFFVPMSVITFCHLRILRKVQKDMIVQNAQFRRTLTSSQRMDAISRKRRVNYTLLGMVFAFVGCNVSLAAVNLAKDFGLEPDFLLRQPYLCPLIAHLIAMSIVCWNPLLFFWLSAKEKGRACSSHAGVVSAAGASAVVTDHNFSSLAIVVNAIRRLSRGELPATTTILTRKETIKLVENDQNWEKTIVGNRQSIGNGHCKSLPKRSGLFAELEHGRRRSSKLSERRNNGKNENTTNKKERISKTDSLLLLPRNGGGQQANAFEIERSHWQQRSGERILNKKQSIAKTASTYSNSF